MKASFLFFTVMLLGGLSSCGKKNAVKPLSDRIRQVWTVNIAKENSAVVYTKGAANNVRPGYAQFQLDLSNTQQQTVRLTEIDNATFVGTWTLSANDTKLILSSLNPQPTATNGTIEYTIDGEVTETMLNLSRSSQNLKTGSTTNQYQLAK